MAIPRENGVKIGKIDHCKLCICTDCRRTIADYDGYTSCPYDVRPCKGCEPTEFVEKCVFRLPGDPLRCKR